jgi:hypothetical protein
MDAYDIGCALAFFLLFVLGCYWGWHVVAKVYFTAFFICNLLALPATVMMLATPRKLDLVVAIFIMAPAAPVAIPFSTIMSSVLEKSQKNATKDPDPDQS